MRYYLSGPMRGFENHNYALFEHTAEILRMSGFEVLSPTELNPPGTPRAQCMINDLAGLVKCDGIICMPGWELSPGACNEVALAWAMDLPAYRVEYTDFRIPDGESSPPVPFWGVEVYPLEATSVTVVRERQYYQHVPLLGVCGYAQSGKDTVAHYMVKGYGWARVAFADTLREMLFALNPVVGELNGVVSRVQGFVLEEGWDKAKLDHKEMRGLLQRLGTEAGREVLGENTWVTLAEHKIERAVPRPVVVSDCRFQNELQMVRRREGTLIWVNRPGVGPHNAHASEHSVTADDCDLVVENDGDFHDLHNKLDLLVANLGWRDQQWNERLAGMPGEELVAA